ncbi:MAG: hypothetical protein ACRCXZ_05085 [Patescibacteria group bacterium]
MIFKNLLIVTLFFCTVLSSNIPSLAQNSNCSELDIVCKRRLACESKANTSPKIITQKRCEKFFEYYKELTDASKKYSTPSLKLKPSTIAAVIDRESLWLYALKPNKCDGTGDNGWGHGLVQIDGYYSTPILGRNGKKNTPVTKRTKKYGPERFNWSSCNESISYVGAHFMSVEDYSSPNLLTKLKQAGLNLERNENQTFKDSKIENAYLKLMLNAYNAGAYGTFNRNSCSVNNKAEVYDGCTTGKNYATDVLNRAKDFEIFENNALNNNLIKKSE